MGWLIFPGIVLSLVGIALLIWCIARVWKAKKSGADDDALRATLQAVLPWNLAAMGLSGIGLMLVVIGVLL